MFFSLEKDIAPSASSSQDVRERRREYDESSFGDLSLDDWLSKFGRIYGKRHDKHTTEYMISRLVEEVAELVNPMESQDNSQIAPNLADVFSWTCSLAFKLDIDLSSLAWQKYGENAPRPSWSPQSSAQPSLQEFSMPRTLRDWQKFISKLYQEENRRLTPTNSLVAMMKDVGDLAMLNRKRAPPEQITSKLAAILAWTLTIAQLLHLDLATVVFEKYDDHCPVCGNSICDTDVCHPFKTMYVSFSSETSDEEKYVILDVASSLGFKTLVNPVSLLESTRDLSSSLDLISKSDLACVLLPSDVSKDSAYGQIFDVLACFSILSKGNVLLFSKDKTSSLERFLDRSFQAEGINVTRYLDSRNLKSLFENSLQTVLDKKQKITSGK
jgi:NTP pyrophosphatase (non-canonical NTP hydrolase)